MLLRQFDHLFQIAIRPLPSIWITAGHNDGAGFFLLGLSKSGLAKFFLLLAIADNDKSPGLKVVTARRFHAGANDLFQIGIVDGHIFKAVGSAAFFNGFAEQLLTCD